MKQIIIFISIFLFISAPFRGDVPGKGTFSPFTFAVKPDVTIPLGTYSDIFKPGGGISFSAQYDFSTMPFFIRCSTTYDFIPLEGDLSISLLSLQGEGGMTFTIIPGFTISPYTGFGYFYSFLNTNLQYYGSHPFGMLGFECGLSLSQAVCLGFNTGYRHFFGFNDDIYISIIGSLTFPEKIQKGLELSIPDFNAIYPVLLNFYQDNPIGSISVTNQFQKPVILTQISMKIDSYMEESWTELLNRHVETNSVIDIDLYGNFNHTILDNKTDEYARAIVTIEYILNKKKKKKTTSGDLLFHSRNKIKRDDFKQIAAFISRNNTDIQLFTDPIKKTLDEYSLPEKNSSILTAIAVYNALKLSGIKKIEEIQPDLENENMRFPGTTLAEKQGDEKDIIVLLSSALESLDIDTALVYTPDDCYIAFSLDCDPESFSQEYTNIENIIIIQNSVWIPFSIEPEKNDFFQAVQTGADTWNEYKKKESARFYTIHDLHTLYNSIDMSGKQPDTGVEILNEEAILHAFNSDIGAYFDQESTPKPRLLETVKNSSSNDYKIMNNLAVLCAKYHLYDKAIHLLTDILLNYDYIPALNNMGNIYFLTGEMKKARAFYERAYEKDSIHPVILLSLARVNFAMENYGNAKDYYRKLMSIEPGLASMFEYLLLSGEEAYYWTTNSEERKKIIWIEE